jgi:chemotaxis signal transduction protein
MSDARSHVMERAAELRFAFDRAFGEPLQIDTTAKEDLLAIRAGGQACAMRLSEITGLFADKRITRVPGGEAALLGIAGFRGAIVPVYSMQSLLGPGHSAAQAPRWLVMARAAPVALAFEAFEGQLRVLLDAILPRQPRAELRSYAQEFVRTQDLTRPIVHLPSVLAAIKAQRPEPAPNEER